MHLLTLAVRPGQLESALDLLLPRFPDGVHLLEQEDRTDVLVYRDQPPDPVTGLDDLLLGPPTLTEVSDDWRERRRDRFRPRVYGGRLAVRPEWAPPPGDGLLDVVLVAEAAAFGTGDHPTTRACLELLSHLGPEDSLADLGCGSGVVAIAAARLGWGTVHAVDVDPRSVRATTENARRNQVDVSTRVLDLVREPPPPATLSVANVPSWVHERLAPRVSSRTVVATGIESRHREAVARAYQAAGYRQVVLEDLMGWSLLVAERARP